VSGRSASRFSVSSSASRIDVMPGENADQYKRNFARADASVAVARVSVRKTECVAPIGSARSVHAILA
jgi:hypothetical protein